MDNEGSDGEGQGGGPPRNVLRRLTHDDTRREDGPDRSTASDSAPVPSPMPLSMADLPALMRALGNAAHYTYNLGTQLGLDPHLVRTLEKQAMVDPVKFLNLVLEQRLRSSPTLTLPALLDAISKPPVDDEDLAWKLEQEFMNPSPVACSSHTSVSPEMAKFSDYLDTIYEDNPLPYDPKGGPRTSNSYINLAVVKKEKVSPADADVFTKATLRGGIDQIMNKKEAIELKDIFVPETAQEKVKFVLVEGAPGIGKSTFAWELCRSRRKLEAMREFLAVVHLSLREKDVQEADSLADLFYHPNHRIQQAVVDEISYNEGESILLVLDGFDEVPSRLRKSFFLAQVIRGKQLPKATVLVTSRPSARDDLLSLRPSDKHVKHIEVLGFTEELIKQYASSVFNFDSALVTDFCTYISTNPSIRSMMYVPLNSAIVVEIYQENRTAGKPIPQTMTQLYSEVTLSRMSRHLVANDDQSVELPDKLQDLHKECPHVYDQLLSLAKLAFEGTLKQEVIFDKLPAGCSTLGLMTTSNRLITRRKVSARHNFIHLTMQEFLSAFYISQLPGSEQKAAFEQYSVRRPESLEEPAFSHMDVVWQFVAGLTGFGDIGWELVKSRRGSFEEDEVSQDIVQYLYEAQGKVDYASVLGRSKVTYSSLLVCTAFDCFALGYCIAASRCTWDIEFRFLSAIIEMALLAPKFIGLGPESIEMLVCGLRSQENVCGRIERLKLSGNSIGPEGVAHLGKMPLIILQQLSHLDINRCNLDTTALDLLSDIIPTMTSLRYLDIGANPAVAVKLLQTLAATSHLHTLKIGGITMGHDDVNSLTQLIRPGGELKELWVNDDHYMQPDCMKLLVQTVLSPSSLTHLTMYITDWTLVSLAPLRHNHNITVLQLICSNVLDTTIGREVISPIAEAHYTNTTLAYVYVDAVEYNVTSAVLVKLSDALKVNQTLKVLKLNCELLSEFRSREAVRSVIGALQHNLTLERVEFHRSWMGVYSPQELMLMDRRVQFVLYFEPVG